MRDLSKPTIWIDVLDNGYIVCTMDTNLKEKRKYASTIPEACELLESLLKKVKL